MGALVLAGVEKRYGNAPVLRAIDLHVPHGALAVVVGPSGCGKSTLLRLVAGLDPVSAGRITIDGRDVTSLPPVERNVSMVFQSYALFPHMTVEENIGFGLRMAGAAKEVRRRAVAEAARVLQLEPLLARRPAELSGGQRQRVAIGRAIVKHPSIFLFDEPLSNLDAGLRTQMRLEIARLHRELGATMIHVTHDQVEAMTLADTIVVLRDGRVEQTGAPMTLYDQPENAFVAGFIGSPRINMVDAIVAACDDRGVTVSAPSLGLDALVVPARTRPAPGTRVVLAFRPEHATLAQDGGTAAVDIVEQLGSTAYLHATTAGHAAIVLEHRAAPLVRAGDAIRFTIDTRRALVFQGPDGARV